MLQQFLIWLPNFAVNKVGAAETLVNTLPIGLLGVLALAPGPAFGPGERKPAAEIVRGWYQQDEKSMPKIERAIRGAERQASDDQQALRRLLEHAPSAE